MNLTGRGFSVAVNVPTLEALLTSVRACFAHGQGFALVTINLDHLVKLRSSQSFRDAYAKHDFVVADGNPVVWMSKLAGQPVQLVPGSDSILPLASVAERAGVSVALVGGTEDSLARSAKALKSQIPELQIALCLAPPFGFDPESDAAGKILEQVASSGAGLCFLALGAPKQEILAARGRSIAPNVGFASIGAGLDFLAGSQSRAPAWVRRLALEWLWRMLSNPKRLAMRYAKCAAILPGHLWRAVLQRGR